MGSVARDPDVRWDWMHDADSRSPELWSSLGRSMAVYSLKNKHRKRRSVSVVGICVLLRGSYAHRISGRLGWRAVLAQAVRVQLNWTAVESPLRFFRSRPRCCLRDFMWTTTRSRGLRLDLSQRCSALQQHVRLIHHENRDAASDAGTRAQTARDMMIGGAVAHNLPSP